MSLPLSNIRILDLSSMLSGPWAADLLGDQGADVIKIEVPGKGDHVRSLQHGANGMASMFVNINRSKRSLTLDLKTSEGVQLLKRLAADADVVIQNFRPGVVDRLGVGYDALSAVNPGLVYLSISGFGEIGPYADRRVYDPIVQALSGLTTIQAGADSERPRLIRTVLPDKLSAVTAAQAVSAALVGRVSTGKGRHIRLSMLDAVLAFLWASDMGAYTFVDQPTKPEQAASFIDLIYATAEGYITVSTMSNAEWQALCKAVGHPEWLEDDRFKTAAGRDAHVNERLILVQSALIERPASEWLEILPKHDVPCAPALTRAELLTDPQVLASNVLIEYDHPVAGRLRQTRPAARFEGVTVPSPRGAPRLGEHNREILAELGLTSQEINDLAIRGVIGTEADIALDEKEEQTA